MKWNFPWQKKHQNSVLEDKLVGIYIDLQGISIAVVKGIELEDCHIQLCKFIECVDPNAYQELIFQFVEEHELKEMPCAFILNGDDYQINLVEMPDDADLDYQGKLKEAVKDAIEHSIDDIDITSFDLPVPRANDNKKMGYAVSILMHRVPKIEQLIQGTGLKLKYVDIVEMSLKNLIRHHPKSQDGILLMRMHSRGGNILLFRKNVIYLIRNMDLNLFKYTKEALQENEPAEDDTLDNLTLDVQRSMDYCSSLFRVSPANSILLTPSVVDEGLIKNYLSEHLGIDTDIFNIQDILANETSMSLDEQANCLIAIGGALRHVKVKDEPGD